MRGPWPGGGLAYVVLYESATMPGRPSSARLGGMLQPAEPESPVTGADQDQGPGEAGAVGLIPASLFIVERRLPQIDDHQLMVLQSALTSVASRFSARGDGVHLLGSLFLSGQERLLSLFTADSAESVRAVNEASLVPFASIEPAVGLPGTGGP